MQMSGIPIESHFSDRENSRVFSGREDLRVEELPYWRPLEQLRGFFRQPYRARVGTNTLGEVFAYIIEHLDGGLAGVADNTKFGVKVTFQNGNTISAPILEDILSYLESKPPRDRAIYFTNDLNSTYVYF